MRANISRLWLELRLRLGLRFALWLGNWRAHQAQADLQQLGLRQLAVTAVGVISKRLNDHKELLRRLPLSHLAILCVLTQLGSYHFDILDSVVWHGEEVGKRPCRRRSLPGEQRLHDGKLLVCHARLDCGLNVCVLLLPAALDGYPRLHATTPASPRTTAALRLNCGLDACVVLLPAAIADCPRLLHVATPASARTAMTAALRLNKCDLNVCAVLLPATSTLVDCPRLLHAATPASARTTTTAAPLTATLVGAFAHQLLLRHRCGCGAWHVGAGGLPAVTARPAVWWVNSAEYLVCAEAGLVHLPTQPPGLHHHVNRREPPTAGSS